MPKISELPEGATLDGTETVAMVQAGATVQVSLSALLSAPREADAVNARWITGNEAIGSGFINSSTFEIVLSNSGGC